MEAGAAREAVWMEVSPWPIWVFWAFPFALACVLCWGLQVRCLDHEERPNPLVVLALAVLGVWVQSATAHGSVFFAVVGGGYLLWGFGHGAWQRHGERMAYLRGGGRGGEPARWWR